MIKICGIYTIRNTPQPYYWDIVFEWEDEFSRALKVPLIPVGHLYDNIYKPSLVKKIGNRLNLYQLRDHFFYDPKEFYLAFHIGPPGVYSFYTRQDVIPIIIDFWKNENLKRFVKIFKLSKKVFITSREVYNDLVKNNFSLNLAHLSLSLPDRYSRLEIDNKDIDIIQLGRQNKTLNEYMNRLIKDNPEINYVYSVKENGKAYLKSTKSGLLDTKGTREFFINTLKRSKISLLAAPGLDDDSSRTGGYSPVTPRFLESVACKCFLMGIYPDNADFEFHNINKICYKITDYDSFENKIKEFLKNDIIPDYRDFIQQTVSSLKAKEFIEKINS